MNAMPNHRAVIKRVLACPSTQKTLDAISEKLVGKHIRSVEFIIENTEIAVSLQLNDGQTVLVIMPELSLKQLLRDPQIAREEQEIYYRNHAYRPLTSPGKNRKGNRTRESTDSVSSVHI